MQYFMANVRGGEACNEVCRNRGRECYSLFWVVMLVGLLFKVEVQGVGRLRCSR